MSGTCCFWEDEVVCCTLQPLYCFTLFEECFYRPDLRFSMSIVFKESRGFQVERGLASMILVPPPEDICYIAEYLADFYLYCIRTHQRFLFIQKSLYGLLPRPRKPLKPINTHDKRAPPSSQTSQVLQVPHHFLQWHPRCNLSLLTRANSIGSTY